MFIELTMDLPALGRRKGERLECDPLEGHGHIRGGWAVEVKTTEQLLDDIARKHNDLLDLHQKTALGEQTGSLGGYTVPTDYANKMFPILQATNPFLRFGNVQLTETNSAVFPAFETVGSASDANLFGGLMPTWIETDTPPTELEPAFSSLNLRLRTLSAYSVFSNAFGADSIADRNRVVAGPLNWEIMRAFLVGNGTTQPLGAINHAALISVSRSGSNLIAAADLAGMMGRLLCSDWSRVFWACNPGCLPQIAKVASVALSVNSDHRGLTLNGLPLFPHAGMPALGSAGDIVLVNGEHHQTLIHKTSPEITESVHIPALFVKGQSAIRGTARIDGGFLTPSAIAPALGSSLSPCVALTT